MKKLNSTKTEKGKTKDNINIMSILSHKFLQKCEVIIYRQDDKISSDHIRKDFRNLNLSTLTPPKIKGKIVINEESGKSEYDLQQYIHHIKYGQKLEKLKDK